jgi:ribonuclease HI
VDKSVSPTLTAITCWYLWLERNKSIFENVVPSAHLVIYKILGLYRLHTSSSPHVPIKECLIQYVEGSSIVFFNGAIRSDRLYCGAGGMIKTVDNIVYRWNINCGIGNNTKAELMGIWETLTLSNHISLPRLQAFVDSRVIIEWLNDRGKLDVFPIEGWKTRTKDLIKKFQYLSFHHLYREFNKENDKLSKEALLVPKGKIIYYQWEPGGVGQTKHLTIS